MNLLFAGTPPIAVPTLRGLAAAGHRIAVLTNPDAPVGRGGTLAASPVKLAALELGLVVHQPAKLDGEARAALAGRFDLLVSFAYGKIFGPKFWRSFPGGGSMFIRRSFPDGGGHRR
jgi:methionyl-tRNA formyltransferase